MDEAIPLDHPRRYASRVIRRYDLIQNARSSYYYDNVYYSNGLGERDKINSKMGDSSATNYFGVNENLILTVHKQIRYTLISTAS